MDRYQEISAVDNISATRRCQAVDNVAREFIGVMDRKTIIDRGLRAIMCETGCQLAALWLPGSSTPNYIHGWPLPPPDHIMKTLQQMPAPRGNAEGSQEPQVFSFNDATGPYAALLHEHGLPYLCKVVLVSEKQYLGALLLLRNTQQRFSQHDTRVISQLSSLFALAVARSVTDPATSLSATVRHQMWADLNHRVRNNMAMICALLEMEMMEAADGEESRLLISLARIRSLTLVYNLVLQNENGDVEIDELFRGVISTITSLFHHNNGKMLVHSDISIYIDQNRATYLSLILTELVVHIVQCISSCASPCSPVIEVKEAAGQISIELTNARVQKCARNPISTLSSEILVGLVERSLHGSISMGDDIGNNITICFPVVENG